MFSGSGFCRIGIIYLSTLKDQSTGEAFSPQKEYPAPQKINFIDFLLFLWVIFAFLDPDPDCASGSRDPVESDPIQIGIRIHNTSENQHYRYLPQSGKRMHLL
jgi:hypothetical protein